MILPKLGLETGTIEVKGERSHCCATHANHWYKAPFLPTELLFVKGMNILSN